jgi:hypothetical protein
MEQSVIVEYYLNTAKMHLWRHFQMLSFQLSMTDSTVYQFHALPNKFQHLTIKFAILVYNESQWVSVDFCYSAYVTNS